MECGLLLNVVVSQGATILKLLACKDEALLVRWDACIQDKKIGCVLARSS